MGRLGSGHVNDLVRTQEGGTVGDWHSSMGCPERYSFGQWAIDLHKEMDICQERY